MQWQIGFLTQWQLYAQQIEGDSWRDASLDQVTFEKLNGDSRRSVVQIKAHTSMQMTRKCSCTNS